jgi:RimJ/RimL family protein N-acetyltransferase
MTAMIERIHPGPQNSLAAALAAQVPTLEGARVTLRAPQVADFDAWAAICAGPRAAHIGGPFTREQAWGDFANYVSGWMLHGHGLWTIDAGEARALGFVLLGYEWDDPEAELGILMTEAAEGQGLAFEAVALVRGYALDTLSWHSVASFVAPDNHRCIRLMKALGAKRDPAAEARIAHAALVFRHSREVRA